MKHSCNKLRKNNALSAKVLSLRLRQKEPTHKSQASDGMDLSSYKGELMYIYDLYFFVKWSLQVLLPFQFSFGRLYLDTGPCLPTAKLTTIMIIIIYHIYGVWRVIRSSMCGVLRRAYIGYLI